MLHKVWKTSQFLITLLHQFKHYPIPLQEQGNLYFNQVTHVIIDEVDTMLTQGFGADIRAILRSSTNSQVIMSTATLTKAVKALLEDVKGFNIEYADSTNKTPRKLTGEEGRVSMNIVEVDGVHMTLPNVQHDVEEVKGLDKLLVLNSVIERYQPKKMRSLIFCNTVDSCRAVEYSLKENGGFLIFTIYLEIGIIVFAY